MAFDPATLLLGAVVLLLFAILVGVGISAALERHEPEVGRWVTEELDDLSGRVAEMRRQITMLKEEIEQLYDEIERLEDDSEQMRAVLLRIAELLERFPRGGMR